MTIEFHCTSCNKMLRVKDESAGKKAKCPACSTILQIPATGSPASQIPASPSPAESNPFDFSAASPPRNAPAAPASDNPFASPQETYDTPHAGAARPGEIVPTRIDAGDIFSTTWEIFKSQMGMTIGVYFVTFFINLAVGFVLGIIQGIMGEDAVAIAIVLQLAANLFSIFLTIGLLLIYLDIARGRAASFDKLFAGGPYFLTVILAIEKRFGSLEKWSDDFVSSAKDAAGWAMLVKHPVHGKLYNVVSDEHAMGVLWMTVPLIVIDTYEHAFYIDYQNRKAEYVENFLGHIDWNEVNHRYAAH